MESTKDDLETLREVVDAPRPGQGRSTGTGRSSVAILAIAAAVGLNIAGLAVVTIAVTSTRDRLERRLEAAAVPAVAAAQPRLAAPAPADVSDLLEIARRLDDVDAEGARRLRARAQELLLQREGEEGAYDLALQLLRQGRTREARRALYRILARADQPGTRWREVAARAQFRIGDTLAEEADQAAATGEGDR